MATISYTETYISDGVKLVVWDGYTLGDDLAPYKLVGHEYISAQYVKNSTLRTDIYVSNNINVADTKGIGQTGTDDNQLFPIDIFGKYLWVKLVPAAGAGTAKFSVLFKEI